MQPNASRDPQSPGDGHPPESGEPPSSFNAIKVLWLSLPIAIWIGAPLGMWLQYAVKSLPGAANLMIPSWHQDVGTLCVCLFLFAPFASYWSWQACVNIQPVEKRDFGIKLLLLFHVLANLILIPSMALAVLLILTTTTF